MPSSLNRITQVRQMMLEMCKPDSAWYVGEVVRVDTTTRTAVVDDVQGGMTATVTLQSAGANDGMVLYPAVGSWVLVAALSDLGGTGSVLLTESLTGFEVLIGSSKLTLKDGEIAFNDGSLGGLVKVVELQNQLDKVVNILQGLIQVLAVPVAEAGGGAPSSFQAALNVALSALPIPNFMNIENSNVKHG